MSPVLAWLVIIALCLTLVFLLAHIGWTIAGLFRRSRNDPLARDGDPGKKLDPAVLVQQAETAEAAGNHILGVRLLFRACLARLEQAEGKTIRLGTTNREHLNRYRATPLYEWLVRFVTVIDLKWYGSEPCGAADFAACREAFGQISIWIARTGNAQRA
jgi:hypothetical protein